MVGFRLRARDYFGVFKKYRNLHKLEPSRAGRTVRVKIGDTEVVADDYCPRCRP